MENEVAIGLDPSEYKYHLEEKGILFIESDVYFHIGISERNQGWILHLSFEPSDSNEIFEIIFSLYEMYQFPFKLIKNRKLHTELNCGKCGQVKVGKILSIYLENEEYINDVVRVLVSKTNKFLGPKVVTDFRIGNILYARYGSFSSQVLIDGYGNLDRVIMDGRGVWVKDRYRTDLLLPKGIDNPFLKFMESEIAYNWRAHVPFGLLVGESIRDEIWGGFYDGTYVQSEISTTCTVIRCRKRSCVDEWGRDMNERLHWALNVMEDVYSTSISPKIIDAWDDVENRFWILDLCLSNNILTLSTKVLDRRSWSDLSADQKIVLVDYILGLIANMGVLNGKGYIHGNITPENIYILDDDRVFLFGFDLAYNFNSLLPNPPYQDLLHNHVHRDYNFHPQPKIEDDILALGMVMVNVFTGISYQNINDIDDSDNFLDRLVFVLGDETLANLLNWCLFEEFSLRPTIREIKTEFLLYRDGLVQGCDANDGGREHPGTGQVESVALGAIMVLGSSRLSIEKKWFSYVDNKYGEEVYPLLDKHFFWGLHRGVSGVLYLLCKAKELGICIDILDEYISSSLSFVDQNVIKEIDRVSPGLHFGASGVAVMIARALDSGLINLENGHWDIFDIFFRKKNPKIDIIYGRAGDGLALIQCRKYIAPSVFNILMASIVNDITGKQESDGVWGNKKNRTEGGISYGFGYGVAGIVYFLLEYWSIYQRNDAMESALKGLMHLDRVRLELKSVYIWPSGSADSKEKLGWCKGGAGIALTYLKSFELTGNQEHLRIAECTLRRLPARIVCGNLSQCHGLSGLGEIYIEAFRITQSEEWWDRAAWIANTIFKLKFGSKGDGYWWFVDQIKFSTADFMIGNSGAIHFLLRYLHSDKVFFPLVPEPVTRNMHSY